MKDIIIVGISDLAELAYYYFKNDTTDINVVGFAVDKKFKIEDTFQGLKVYNLEDIENNFNQDSIFLFIAIGYSSLNHLRKEKYLFFKNKGYRFVSYISSKAVVLTEMIGEHVFIPEGNIIQPFVEIGNNVFFWSNAVVAHHSIIGDHSFITCNVTINGRVTVGENCFIGAGSIIKDHLHIGKESLIAMGSIVVENTEAESLYIGTKAKKQNKKSKEVTKI